MTATLCSIIPESFIHSNSTKIFFEGDLETTIRKFEDSREHPKPATPGDSCKTNLFFGFFFDGTKNNYEKGDVAGNQSNIARLYDAYPGQSVDLVLPKTSDWINKQNYENFFRVYAPGVASPFAAIGDSGVGSDEFKGGAFGFLGEDRIKWALIQALNIIHRYFYKEPLLSPEKTLSTMKKMTLTAAQRKEMSNWQPRQQQQQQDELQRQRQTTADVFGDLLGTLHDHLRIHWPDPATNRPAKIEPCEVNTIYISTFGFSRGAAQARAFTNWFMSLCELDARLCKRGGGASLGGFNVEFDFLGLFDTVASIGIANTLGDSRFLGGFDGHGAWADAEDSLRIHSAVKKCVHLVAPHEIRRSFPVDSVSVGQSLPANCEEIVFPGVHSDLGSGYCPLEQGRGVDPTGADMLARIPLLLMYQNARIAGVPLKLELAGEKVQNKFKVSPTTIASLNAYLKNCSVKEGTLTDIMREQGAMQMLWRKTRRTGSPDSVEKTDSFKRATNFDKNDLHSANLEFEDEIKKLESWISSKGTGFRPKKQAAGFSNKYEKELEEIAFWWLESAPLDKSVLEFFDDYVHDSHAWFKVDQKFPDSEVMLKNELVKWEAKRKRAIDEFDRQASSEGATHNFQTAEQLDGLTDDQRRAAQEFALTGLTPRLITTGRESDTLYGFALNGGYLRFRKIYGGADIVLLSQSTMPVTDHLAVQTRTRTGTEEA